MRTLNYTPVGTSGNYLLAEGKDESGMAVYLQYSTEHKDHFIAHFGCAKGYPILGEAVKMFNRLALTKIGVYKRGALPQ